MDNPIKNLYEGEDVTNILLDLFEKTKWNKELNEKIESLLSTCDDIGFLSKFDGSDKIYYRLYIQK